MSHSREKHCRRNKVKFHGCYVTHESAICRCLCDGCCAANAKILDRRDRAYESRQRNLMGGRR